MHSDAPDYTRLGPKQDDMLLIIGGCGGIGRAVVMAGLAIGLNVVVMDLAASIEIVELPESVATIAIDLRDEISIQTTFEAFDKLAIDLDHIVFASGYTSDLVTVKEMTADILDDVLDGNLRGQVLAARACAKRVTDGNLVFVSTALGQVGVPGYSPYSISKAGTNALTRILAAELAPAIRVNGVAPGPVDTPFIRGGLGRGVLDDADATDGEALRFDRAKFEAQTPMKRIGNADDMAGPILFLLSDAARFVTGQVLHINGGSFMRD